MLQPSGEELILDLRRFKVIQLVSILMCVCVGVCKGEVHGCILLPVAAGRGLSAHLELDWRPNCQSRESRFTLCLL